MGSIVDAYVQLLRAGSSFWRTSARVIKAGELVLDDDKFIVKVGDGVNTYEHSIAVDHRVDQSYPLSSLPASNIVFDFESNNWSLNETFLLDGSKNLKFLNCINGSNFQLDLFMVKGSSDFTITVVLDANGDSKNDYEVALVENASATTFLLQGSATEHRRYTLSGRFVPLLGVPITVTNAVSNGGLIRLTTTTHGLTTGDRVTVETVLGTIEANDYWYVTVIDVNTIDLIGSTFATTYVSGGTVKRDYTEWWISKFEWLSS